ncbi:MAG: extensin family protein [Brevundimonas sp.]|uniref:extensin-like domain-containing protein n=1 Tax=Brevundimonas sp. TaxID=1871086 RepID=UPI0012201541|nr:extensin family protein [Brevundimonas sp.]RZJ19374.1 MAG: extensin family protein [Brevundimonas sp.]
MDRDLADFWNLLWELALAGCAAFALLNLFAPDQDLPWKPLDLRQPLGQATAAKVADFEIPRTAAPEEVKAVTDACIQVLREAGVTVQRADDRDDGGFCVVKGAVRITGGDVTPLSPGGLVMQCPLALRYVIWDRQVLRPAAREIMGSEVASVDNFGSYSCRRIYGSQRPGDRPSEHARANALDVSGVTLKDGRRVDLAADWKGEGRAGPEGGRFLKRVRNGACRVFSTVLTPDYNAAHRDHLHLDGAPRGLCA